MSTADPPNVLVIYTDDTDRDLIGCYGGEGVTPNIDGLAADGVRFERYYTAASLCSPSRYCALTGQYAGRSDQLRRKYPPDGHAEILQEPRIYGEADPHNLAHVLGEHGYTTGMVGKWHQGLAERRADDTDRLVDIDPAADGRDPDVDRAIRENYRTIVETVESCGFDHAASVYFQNPNHLNLPEEMCHHNMDWVTSGALDFLDAHATGEGPFFLWFAPTLTHAPFGEEQLRADPRSTPAGYLDEAPDVQPDREDIIERVREADADAWGRGPLVTWMDDGVGAILDRLEALGVADDTLVVYTSDHADLRGKGSTYQDGSRMPFITRWPDGIDPGRPCSRLASNVDLAPTLYDIAGADPPSDHRIDGRSIRPLLTGEGEYERESLYQEVGVQRAVVTADRFHYIATRFPDEMEAEMERGPTYTHHWNEIEDRSEVRWGVAEDFPAYFDRDQLYDLEADPGEQHNLADDPRYADKLAELQEELREYVADLPHEFGEFT